MHVTCIKLQDINKRRTGASLQKAYITIAITSLQCKQKYPIYLKQRAYNKMNVKSLYDKSEIKLNRVCLI